MDLFEAAAANGQTEVSLIDEYVTFRIDAAACDSALKEDLQGFEAATWLAEVLRHDFEQACFGGRIFGPTGNFEGVLADAMPGYWRRTEQQSAGKPVFQPDGRHPLGKWLADVANRLLPLPSLDLLDAILRRHGIEGSKERMPVMKSFEGGWAVRVHRPKPKAFELAGVTRDNSLAALWKK